MKKASIMLFMLLLGVTFNGFSQASAPSDFFAGKWKINFIGSPYGEVSFPIDIIRKEGKLTVKLDPDASSVFKLTNPKVEEESVTKLVIHFDMPENEGRGVQSRDIPMELAKVDNDNLKGNFMNIDLTAKRVK
jgi:hypothetical protein